MILPVAEVRDKVLAKLTRSILAPIGVKAFPITESLERDETLWEEHLPSIGCHLTAGLAANLSELSIGLMGLRWLPSDLGLMHLFPTLGADRQCPQHTAAAFA
jgi:hypothetical protein